MSKKSLLDKEMSVMIAMNRLNIAWMSKTMADCLAASRALTYSIQVLVRARRAARSATKAIRGGGR